MPQIGVSGIDRLVEDYGRAYEVDISRWTTSYSKFTCMVLGITDRNQANSLTDYLARHGMMAEVVPPSKVVTDWGVVAISD